MVPVWSVRRSTDKAERVNILLISVTYAKKSNVYPIFRAPLSWIKTQDIRTLLCLPLCNIGLLDSVIATLHCGDHPAKMAAVHLCGEGVCLTQQNWRLLTFSVYEYGLPRLL